MDKFSFEFFEQFKEQSLALRFLRSPLLPLAASFFHRIFILKNRRSVGYQELIALLDHHLADINESYKNELGEDKYTKSAKAYVDDWINGKAGYLRKYLPTQGNEPECDLLPDVEKALRWLEDLQGKAFVGTESRLKLLLDLIADLVHGTSQDSEQQLATLEQKKAQLEQQIEAIKQGAQLSYSATEIREKIYLVGDLSRQLLGDFRQVEANFRDLDKQTRRKMATEIDHKGAVLDKVFTDQDVIDDSDEGKSFSAFFELLMRGDLRESMRDDLRQLLVLEHKQNASHDELLLHLYGYLLEAGAKVNDTKKNITEQLRRYIQDQSQDNKRIIELIREFESGVHKHQQQPLADPSYLLSDKRFTQINSFQANISSLFSRSLFAPKAQESLNSEIPDTGDGEAVDLSNLFDASHINEFQLQQQINQCLQQGNGQTTLRQIIQQFPIQYGLDELLTYVKLACEEQTVSANIDHNQQQQIQWRTSDGAIRQANLPTITYVRD